MIVMAEDSVRFAHSGPPTITNNSSSTSYTKPCIPGAAGFLRKIMNIRGLQIFPAMSRVFTTAALEGGARRDSGGRDRVGTCSDGTGQTYPISATTYNYT